MESALNMFGAQRMNKIVCPSNVITTVIVIVFDVFPFYFRTLNILFIVILKEKTSLLMNIEQS